MPSPAICRRADRLAGAPDSDLAARRAAVERLERAFWSTDFDPDLLPPLRAAYRELEAALAEAGDDDRHDFVVVIPVADNPRQTRACLDSLDEQCQAFGYGGGNKVSVLLADDSRTAGARDAHRALAGEFGARGLAVEYFGLDQQLALLDRLDDLDLSGSIGRHRRDDFGHKGQAMMRNVAYLRVAELAARRPRLICLTVDGDQLFRVKVAGAGGGHEVCALNVFFLLDAVFSETDADVLTGKVVGDPPVSPAVMAGNFLDDVIAFLREMAVGVPDAPYRQPVTDTRGSGEAAYHDMADLFGFQPPVEVYRYRCEHPGTPTNIDGFTEFAGRLRGFFHGEHPTRVTWYRHQDVRASIQPARTVYTGNYAFRPDALDWFIPFAPLRLRMSGPTMGRMLRAELGGRFVSVNLPMLHRRTVAGTGVSEFRPGVRGERERVDLCDEFERQFHGDVMLFAMERLTARGFPGRRLAVAELDATLAATQREMTEKYRARHAGIRARLGELVALFDDSGRWWQAEPGLSDARADFRAFVANLDFHFGLDSPCLARIEAETARADWRARQCAALAAYEDDRAAWRQALAILRGS